MLRITGVLLIVMGSVFAAVNLSGGVRNTLRLYKQMQLDLEKIRSEMEFHLTPLPEILAGLSEDAECPFSSFYKSVADAMYTEPGIRPVSAVQTVSAFRELPSEMKKILFDLFDRLGQEDLPAQVRAIELSEARFKRKIEELEKEKRDRCRSYEVLCLCTGVALAIILI